MVIAADPPPLIVDAHGTWRVSGTRVSFDVLITRYLQGDTVSEIAEGFPDVPLADIHWTISYYLRHREECDEYLEWRRREADEIERETRARFRSEDLEGRAREYRETKDAEGVIRIGGTRVSLDSLLHLYHQGATAEEIAASFPDVLLPDVYAAIAYYLRHREEVDRYLESRRREARDLEDEIRRRFPTAELRERLLARRREDSR